MCTTVNADALALVLTYSLIADLTFLSPNLTHFLTASQTRHCNVKLINQTFHLCIISLYVLTHYYIIYDIANIFVKISEQHTSYLTQKREFVVYKKYDKVANNI